MLDNDELITKKIELLLEMNSKKVLSELTVLRSEVEHLRDEVSDMKRVQSRVSAQQPQQSSERASQGPRREEESQGGTESQTPSDQTNQSTTPRPAQSEKIKEPIDRNGIAPADVSIEKIFYFGNK